jgi:hypothetical protein
MKRTLLFIAICLLGILSCVSGPEPLAEVPAVQPKPVPVIQPEPVVQAVPEPPAPPAPESPPAVVHFDSVDVPEEVYTSTKVDVQQFIGNLNQIIRRKDYKGWISNLDESYLSTISSSEYLKSRSRQGFTLRNAEDYFTRVVVPSRANDHIEDIEFVTETPVKAFTVTPNGQRLRLYELNSVGGTWKIVN